MTSRSISTEDVKNTVKKLCLKANTVLREDVLSAMKEVYSKEKDGTPSKKMWQILIENAKIAEKEKLAICQDTGMVSVFIKMGEKVAIDGEGLKDAVNKGVEEAYSEGSLRRSVVKGPIKRENTGTNTPAVIHTDIVRGDSFTIHVMPKGFGSENKSRLIMLNPTCSQEDIIDFCVETVKIAGPDACTPYVLGVGMGGTMEECAILSKKALLRPIDQANPEAHIAELEDKIKEKANALAIGVMGLGGAGTVLGVNIEACATHIAGLPVCVNLSCHALRSASAEL